MRPCKFESLVESNDLIDALVARGWEYDGIQKGLDGEPYAYNFTRRQSGDHGGTLTILADWSVDQAIAYSQKVDKRLQFAYKLATDRKEIKEADDWEPPPAPGDRPTPMGRPELPDEGVHVLMIQSAYAYDEWGPGGEEFKDNVRSIGWALEDQRVKHEILHKDTNYNSNGSGTIYIKGDLTEIINALRNVNSMEIVWDNDTMHGIIVHEDEEDEEDEEDV